MYPIVCAGTVEADTELLRRVRLVPGSTLSLNPSGAEVRVHCRVSRLFGLLPGRMQVLGRLSPDHAAIVLPFLEAGARLRVRVMDLAGQVHAPYGVTISIWAAVPPNMFVRQRGLVPVPS